MDVGRSDEDARAALDRLIAERREDYAGLSRLIGRNAAYIQQYVRRGTPKRLAEDDRRVLARYFGVDEAVLGGPVAEPARRFVPVSRLSVAASAGPGRISETERAVGELGFDPALLRRIGVSGTGEQMALLRVEGESMRPTLRDGDDILVDRSEAGRRLRDGIFVLRREGELMVKRLAPHPAGRRIDVISDNQSFPSFLGCALRDIDVVGRVVWSGGRVA